ncbi:MAG: hypothetical protein WC404_00280 [Candidatus Omnitrophota bacterium]|jgi:hypothetical protein
MITIRDYGYKYHRDGEPNLNFEIARDDLAADPQYSAYFAYNGAWLIQERTIATGLYKYYASIDSTLFAASWAARAGLAYVEFNAL